MNNGLPVILKMLGWIAIIFSALLLIYLFSIAFLLKGSLDLSSEAFFWIFIALGSILPLTEFMLGLSILKRRKFALFAALLFILLGIGVASRQAGPAQAIDLIVTSIHVFIFVTLIYYRRLYGF